MTVDEHKAKIQKITQVETFCMIPGVVLSVLPHRATDEARALLSLLFRIGVLALGIFAVILCEVWKFLLRRELKAAQRSGDVAQDVRYPRE